MNQQSAQPIPAKPTLATRFVGRRPELAMLGGALDDLMMGRGSLVMVEGEPGIGKSRLAREFVGTARDRAKIIWGTCERGAGWAPALWPWTKIAARHSDGADSPAPYRNVITELPRLIGGGRPRTELSADSRQALTARLEPLVRSVLSTLIEAARAQPLILIFDDVDRTDALSLELLGIIAREMEEVLVLASYRDAALKNSAALSEVLANPDFREARRLRLKGLAGEELVELVRDYSGAATDDETAARIARMSGGNPWFAELLVDSGLASREARGPYLTAMLRAAVARHLEPLGAEVRALLKVAAAIGAEFELALLNEVSGGARAQLACLIDHAATAGLIRQMRPGRYAFVHSLVRDALHAELEGRERAQLERRIGAALLTLHAFDPEYLGEAAARFLRAGPENGADDRAVRCCVRAAEHARSLNRFEEAAHFYQMALSGIEEPAGDGGAKGLDLRLELARVERRMGNAGGCARTLARAAAMAEAAGDSPRMARAALALAGDPLSAALGGRCGPQARSMLEKSLCPQTSATPLGAMVSFRLALEMGASAAAGLERLDEELENAAAAARRSKDRDSLLPVLGCRHLALSPQAQRLEARLAIAEEMIDLAAGSDDEQWCAAFLLRQADLLRAGDLARADAASAALLGAAAASGKPVFEQARAAWSAMRAMIDGRFEQAAGEAGRFLKSAESGFPEAVALYLPSAVIAFAELGRLSEIEPLAAESARTRPWLIAARAALARARLRLGDEEGARSGFAALMAHSFEPLRNDPTLPACAAMLASVCAELGERDQAGRLYELLLPYKDQHIVAGALSFMGPAARYLGMLAALERRFLDAQSHFELALAMALRIGARPWTAYTEVALGRMLLSRLQPGDRARAGVCFASSLKIAKALGMKDLARRAAALDAKVRSLAGQGGSADAAADPRPTETPELRTSGPPPLLSSRAVAAPPPADRLAEAEADDSCGRRSLKREGDYWTIVFEGKVLRLRHAKGLSIISWLLRHPQHEFVASALEGLACGVNAPDAPSTFVARDREQRASSGPGTDSAPLLDPAAKAAYQQRLRELREEMAEAKSFNDIGRAARLESEMDFLTREITRSVGLGGRSRRWSTQAERSRVNVTNAIRSVVAKIRRENPTLARYLANTIKTGHFCSFNPDPNTPEPWAV